MKEIFVIYNKTTGFIEGGCGKIDRKKDAVSKDGSTMTERIPLILAKNPKREVIYLPNQSLPDPSKHKIVDGNIIDLTEKDKQTIEDTKPRSEIEKLTKRIEKIEAELNL